MPTTTTTSDGSLYLNDKRGCWELAHHVDAKRYIERVPRRFGTDAQCKAECRRKRNDRRAELAVNAGLDPETVGWLAGEYLTVWLATRSAGTKRNEANRTSIVKDGELGARRIAEVTTLDVKRFLEGVAAERGWESSTKSGLRSTLHGMWECAVAGRKAHTNVVKNLPRERGTKAAKRAAKRRQRLYSLAEYGVACEWLADLDNVDTDAAAVATMLFAGLRSQEVRALRWANVNWQRGVLVITEAVKAASNADGTTKSEAGTRVVPMAPQLVAVLRRHAERQLAAGRTEHVFTDGGERLTHDDVRHAAERFAAQTGLAWCNPHGFRHTFASIALHHGCTYPKLAKLMGHSTVQELIDTYGHDVNDEVDIAALVGTGASSLQEVVGG